MNLDVQLKLQAYVDGELSGPEAAEVQAWLAKDSEAQLLSTELRNTATALAGHETGVKLPESPEFFWGKIEREIQRQEQQPAAVPHVSWLAWLRRQLMPLSGVAVALLVLSVVLQPGRGTGILEEMEIASDDMGAYTFHDQANKTTFVWFYDRTDNSQIAAQPPLAAIVPQ